MSAIAIQQMAQRVADLLEERLGARGPDLATKLRKARRLLPRKVAIAAQELADLAEQAKNPKLLVQVDQGRVAATYDICVRHLTKQKVGGRSKGLLINVAATVALGLLVVLGVAIALQQMRGGL